MKLYIRAWLGSYRLVHLALVLDDQLVGGLSAEGQIDFYISCVGFQHFHVALIQPFNQRTLLEIVELNSLRTNVRVEPNEVGGQQVKATHKIWKKRAVKLLKSDWH